MEDVSPAKYGYYVPQAVLSAEGDWEKIPKNDLEKIGSFRNADQGNMRPLKLACGRGTAAL
jgi:hypothetical protein